MEEQQEIVVEHGEEIAVCVELEEFFRRNLPPEPPDHEAGRIVL